MHVSGCECMCLCIYVYMFVRAQSTLYRARLHTIVHLCTYVCMHVCNMLNKGMCCLKLYIHYLFVALRVSDKKILLCARLHRAPLHMYISMYYICMHTCMYSCIYVCIYACIYVCMYVCTHECMYACIIRKLQISSYTYVTFWSRCG
jgi:hypothetical protein